MINKLKKNYLVVLLGFLVTILVSLVLIMGNMTNELPELQQDEQSMKMLQEVFNEIGYYNYDDVTEIYTVYSDARE
jgi:phosphoketolase